MALGQQDGEREPDHVPLAFDHRFDRLTDPMRRGDQTLHVLSDIVGDSHRASIRVWQPPARIVVRGVLCFLFHCVYRHYGAVGSGATFQDIADEQPSVFFRLIAVLSRRCANPVTLAPRDVVERVAFRSTFPHREDPPCLIGRIP
ncbi:hypothetical protein GCM10009677_56250 [Sphaerisporangium rubeum]